MPHGFGKLRGEAEPSGGRPSESLRSESKGVGMSPITIRPVKRSRWINWKPKARILADRQERTYKTIKTRFCRFCRCRFRQFSRD